MNPRSILTGWLIVGSVVTSNQLLAAEDKPKQTHSSSADGKFVTVKLDEQVRMRYRYGKDVIKPYVEQLRSPAGVNILRDSPFDHKHHHGLMFAVAVDGVNFWEEREPFGREAGVKGMQTISEASGWTTWDGCSQQIDWIGPAEGKRLLTENRKLTLYRSAEIKPTLLTWQSRLSLPEGTQSAKLTGPPQNYFGLGMRFVESMDKGGKFITADGKSGVNDTNGHRAAWCAYSAVADGKPVTVAMFDDPKNFRHPATWFTMEKGFAYLCASLNLGKEPVEMKAGKPLVLRYGVAVWDGTPDPAEIEKVYKKWVALTPPDKKDKPSQ